MTQQQIDRETEKYIRVKLRPGNPIHTLDSHMDDTRDLIAYISAAGSIGGVCL